MIQRNAIDLATDIAQVARIRVDREYHRAWKDEAHAILDNADRAITEAREVLRRRIERRRLARGESPE